jgi:hypothetical protein
MCGCGSYIDPSELEDIEAEIAAEDAADEEALDVTDEFTKVEQEQSVEAE